VSYETNALCDVSTWGWTLLQPQVEPLAKGFPQRLQKRAELSFCTVPQDAHVSPTRRLAPQAEQNAEPVEFAAPQVPQRPGNGGT